MQKEAEALSLYLKDRSNDEMSILSLGGGTLENTEALRLLKSENCVLFVLDEEEDILFERIVRRGIPPFLDQENPEESFRELYVKRRQTLLAQGDQIINIHGLDQQGAAEKTIQVIRSVYGRQ